MDPGDQFRPWSHLPTDLLSLILDRLTFGDHVRFSAACKSFRDVGSKTLHFQSLRHLPWLLIPPRSESWKQPIMWGFYSLSERRVHHFPLPLPSPVISYKGWLLNISPSFHLFNPFTHQRIHLPPFNYHYAEPYKLFLSSSHDSSVLVALITDCGVFLHRTGDSRWICFDNCTHKDILMFDGLIYCVDNLKLYVCEFDPQLVLKYELSVPDIGNWSIPQYYLVESAGDILLVIKNKNYTLQPDNVLNDDYFEGCNLSFAAYKLDPNALRWEEVRCLEDRILFMDSDCLVSVIVGGCSPIGFRNNCIYFIHWGEADYSLLEFCFEDKTITPIKLDLSFGNISTPRWFTFNI